MWCSSKTPEKGWDVHKDGQKEQNVWKELSGETEPQSGPGGLLAKEIVVVMVIMLPQMCKKPPYGKMFWTCIPCAAIAVHFELVAVLRPNRMSPRMRPVSMKN